MKKIILLNIVFLFMASVASAEQVQASFTDAGKSVVGTGGPATNAAIGKLSTKVALGWNSVSGGYAINTQHQQGTKSYGSSYNSSSIYMLDVTKETPVAAPTTTGSDAFSSWKTM